MKKIVVALLFCIPVFTAFPQTSSKQKNIQTLLELTGAGKLGVQAMQNLITFYKNTYTNVDAAFWQEFSKETDANELNNLIIPIYDKYYTEEEVKQMIAFYKTPLGKKITQTMSPIMQESMEAGQKWGKEISEKVIKRLKEKGYIQ